jgi:tRNA(Ile)-lysidine synthase
MPQNQLLIERVKKTVYDLRMLSRGDRVIVAVSGGPDSVCLLHVLCKLRKALNLDLVVAHLNHLLRAKEAAADCLFVQKLAQKLALPFKSEEVDVGKFAKEKNLSLETAAREVRYDFLFRLAKERKAEKIAVGHSRDDQVETVLMRLIRGAGTDGLRGIPATRRYQDCLIIRPLIDTWRKEILEYLAKEKISFRQDSTNQDQDILRNRLRHELLPLLEGKYNPAVKDALFNLTQNLKDDFAFLRQESEKKFRNLAKLAAGEVKLDLKKLQKLPPALQKMLFRLSIEKIQGHTRKIDLRHWREVNELFSLRPLHALVYLPNGLAVKKTATELVFLRQEKANHCP